MTMNEEKLMEIYRRERDYQKCCFGEYKDIGSLNFASFLLFIEQYLKKAKEGYCGPWQKQLPDWLSACKEMEEGSAPIEAYEQLIKVFVLAGAALETFADVSPPNWRDNADEDGQKWKT